MRRRACAIGLVLALAAPAAGQDGPTPQEVLAAFGEGVSAPRSAEEGTLLTEAPETREILSDPRTLMLVNRSIREVVLRDSGWAFVRDVQLELKTFHQDGSDPETFLGLAWAYRKDIADHEIPTERFADHAELDVSFSTHGNVSFDRDRNVEDFLATKLDAGFYGSWGGVTGPLGRAQQERYNELLVITSGMDQEAFDASAEKQELLALGRSVLTNQYGFDLQGILGFETDQSWDAQQLVYGGELGLVVSPWKDFDGRTWGEISRFARLNVLDYPFALVRLVTGMDEGFAPRSMSVPAVVAGFAWVDPQSGDPREAVSDGGGFPRLHVFGSFRTPLLELGDTETLGLLGTVYADATLRYWREIDAERAVERAGLDEYTYWTVSLSSSSGVFASYSRGRLPFDASTDNVYQLGFRFHF